ncbi:MAG: hypothetical protein WAO95_08060, partial [Burkholderiales bacterium]
PERAACRRELGGDVPAQRRVDLLEQNGGAPGAARSERTAHDAARGAFLPAARIEVDRYDLRGAAGMRAEQDRDFARAAEEGRGAVGGAGQVIGEDQDLRQG